MYEEIQDHYPLEFALRDQDKYRYRYPKGEVSSCSVRRRATRRPAVGTRQTTVVMKRPSS